MPVPERNSPQEGKAIELERETLPPPGAAQKRKGNTVESAREVPD